MGSGVSSWAVACKIENQGFHERVSNERNVGCIFNVICIDTDGNRNIEER